MGIKQIRVDKKPKFKKMKKSDMKLADPKQLRQSPQTRQSKQANPKKIDLNAKNLGKKTKKLKPGKKMDFKAKKLKV